MMMMMMMMMMMIIIIIIIIIISTTIEGYKIAQLNVVIDVVGGRRRSEDGDDKHLWKSRKASFEKNAESSTMHHSEHRQSVQITTS